MPNTCFALRSSKTLLLLCVAALVAIGCGNAGPGLEDTARNISRRSAPLNDTGMAGGASEESYAAVTEDEADDEDLAEDDDMSDETPDAAVEDAMAPAPAPDGSAGLISDDSARCGNGVLDLGEMCDFNIKSGEPGACPTECEQPDACHEGKLEVRSCWTHCVEGDLIDC